MSGKSEWKENRRLKAKALLAEAVTCFAVLLYGIHLCTELHFVSVHNTNIFTFMKLYYVPREQSVR